MIDSHAHLYFDKFDGDRNAVIDRARKAGVDAVINIGIDTRTSVQAIQLAEVEENFFATVGVHPTSPIDDVEAAVSEIRGLATSHATHVVAIGEIGLDYYWKDVPPSAQKPKLQAQLALAVELHLPVVFHCRDALDDLFAELRRAPALPPGVFHCFSGSPADAEHALQLGYHVSFAGNVTYPKAEELRTTATAVPPDKLLLETDAPFLAPQPRRGKRNEPAFLPFTCECLARVHGMEPTELEALATETTRRLFGLRTNRGAS